MELGRFAQVDALLNAGWIRDPQCEAMQAADRYRMGGPTYLCSPEGQIHAVSGGTQRPVDLVEWAARVEADRLAHEAWQEKSQEQRSLEASLIQQAANFRFEHAGDGNVRSAP